MNDRAHLVPPRPPRSWAAHLPGRRLGSGVPVPARRLARGRAGLDCRDQDRPRRSGARGRRRSSPAVVAAAQRSQAWDRGDHVLRDPLLAPRVRDADAPRRAGIAADGDDALVHGPDFDHVAAAAAEPFDPRRARGRVRRRRRAPRRIDRVDRTRNRSCVPRRPRRRAQLRRRRHVCPAVDERHQAA